MPGTRILRNRIIEHLVSYLKRCIVLLRRLEVDLLEEKTQADDGSVTALLEQWYAEEDDKSDEWWDEFERDLQSNRLHLREADVG